MRRASSRRGAAVLVMTLVAGLAACAGIPTSGPVLEGDAEVAEPSGVVLFPDGPQPDAQPQAIVEGFLLAGAAGLSADFTVAREFLVGDFRSAWDPSDGVVVAKDITYEGTAAAQITAGLTVLGRVDDAGRFAEASPDSRESVTFDLRRSSTGQWRIADGPAGLIVAPRVFEQQYRAAPLYFLSPDATVLVPEVRHFPARNLATSVVQALLDGPSPWLRDAVRTAVPDGVELKPQAVQISADGSAEVVLQPAMAVQEADRGLLLAQVEASLDLPGISAVRVRAGPGGAVLADPTPFAEPPALDAIALSGDTLVRLGTDGPAPVAGVADLTGLAARWPATSEDGALRVAVADGSALVRLPTDDQGPTTLLTAPGLVAPSVDRLGWIWTATTGSTDGVVRAVDAGGDDVAVGASWLVGRTVRSVRVAADGTRIAIASVGVDGASLDVAGIVRDEAGAPQQLSEPVRAGASLTAADQVVWIDPTTLGVLGREAGSTTLASVPVSGLTTPLPGVADAVALAAGRGERTLLVATETQELLRFDGRTWAAVAQDVRDPAYPG